MYLFYELLTIFHSIKLHQIW